MEGLHSYVPPPPHHHAPPSHGFTVGIVGAVLVVTTHILTAEMRGWDWLDGWAPWRRAAAVALALAAVVFAPGFNPAFIYFQF